MNDSNNAAINNAEEVIERFGGIRPMAKKIDVAVTTVQGWKKRNVIPGARRDQVLEAARVHNVDLSDIMSASLNVFVANQNTATASASASQAVNSQMRDEVVRSVPPSSPLDLERKLAETEKRAVKKSAWINIVLIVLALGAAGVLLWPQTQVKVQDEARLSTLENNVGQLRGDVEAVKAEQSFLSTLIPKDLDERIAKLQQQAQETQEKIGSAIEKAGEISQDVLAENAGTIGQRMDILESHMNELAATPQMSALIDRFQTMRQSIAGDQQLDQAVAELSAFVSSFDATSAPVEEALAAARSQSTTLSQTFEGVPPQDMKAAALLLGMSQFRQTLNRDNTPFADDLQLLISLTGKDDPELTEALQRLGPKAEQGVLTPAGLSNEFKTMAGEAVIASLKGEDVSITDKARAHLNELFQVEKNGELVTGTPTQATVAKAQRLLDEGDVAGAIAQVETLEGPAATVTQPWLDQARATLIAEQFKAMLDKSMSAVAAGTSRLIQDEASGVNILPPAQPLNKDIYQ